VLVVATGMGTVMVMDMVTDMEGEFVIFILDF
jgi:hypothetical protein